jgi:hypothetical protein
LIYTVLITPVPHLVNSYVYNQLQEIKVHKNEISCIVIIFTSHFIKID